MLKKKLTKAGLLGHGFLLIIPYNVGIVNKLNNTHLQLAEKTVQAKCTNFFGDTNAVDNPDTSNVAVNVFSDHLPPAPEFHLNASAAKFVKNYIQKNNEDLQKIKSRSANYFRTIEFVFKKNNLPPGLKYLAVVESELNTTAVSHAGAVGLWQLMPETARDFGLKIAKKNDERKHFYKSTEAAAKYLKSLYSEFNDWLLVIAAYNSGSGTVLNAIHRSGSRNFWKLQYFLPAETRAHVKRFIGTHYFFEKEGGLTTLTKEETAQYKKTAVDFAAKKDSLLNKQIASVR